MSEKTHLIWHDHVVVRPPGCVVWFTGLSGSGKSTVANCVDAELYKLGINSFVLDGDNIRHGLNASPEILEPEHGVDFAHRFGLTFAAADREENIRRVGCVAQIFCSAGMIALTAFVSPYRRDRNQVRSSVNATRGDNNFVEVFVDTPIEICEARDPKGLYKKARAGEITGFTGIDDPYQEPDNPEIRLDGSQPVERSAALVLEYLRSIRKIS